MAGHLGVSRMGGWALVMLGAVAWIGALLALPFFNRDRLRAGDIIAGTWVVETPKSALLRWVFLTPRSKADGPWSRSVCRCAAT